MMGVSTGLDALLIDIRTYASYRLYLENLGQLPKLSVFRARAEADVDAIDSYFSINRDNPYALQHFLTWHLRGLPVTQMTQFPPLRRRQTPPERERRLRSLYELAAPGDAVFSADLSSQVSALIRRYDRCQWSHVAPVTSKRTVVDAGPGGVVESCFDSLANPDFSVALYRVRDATTEQREGAAVAAERLIGVKGYGWYRVLRLYLRNQFKIPYPEGMSVSDLIASNKFRLISWV